MSAGYLNTVLELVELVLKDRAGHVLVRVECGWCKRNMGAKWIAGADSLEPTTGICDSCAERIGGDDAEP